MMRLFDYNQMVNALKDASEMIPEIFEITVVQCPECWAPLTDMQRVEDFVLCQCEQCGLTARKVC